MDRSILSLALVSVLAFCSAASATDPIPPAPVNDAPAAAEYVVHIKVLGTRDDGLKKVLAEPSLLVSANRRSSFLSGGFVPAGGEEVSIGTVARLTVSPASRSQVLVVGMIEIAEIVDRGKGVHLRHAEAAYFKKSVKLGKTVRLPFASTPDATQWIELTVEPIDSTDAGQASQSAQR